MSDDPDIREHYHKFLVHIYHSMLSQLSKKDKFMEKRGFIPLKDTLIDAYFTRIAYNYRWFDKRVITGKGTYISTANANGFNFDNYFVWLGCFRGFFLNQLNFSNS